MKWLYRRKEKFDMTRQQIVTLLDLEVTG